MTEQKHDIIPHADATQPRLIMHPMVEKMLAQNPTPETLAKLMDLQREWQKDVAKQAYTNALVAMRHDLPAWIKRDKTVKYDNVRYTHASLAATMDAILPALTAHGFSLAWTTAMDPKGAVIVTAELTHRDGHSEKGATLTAPPDSKGSKSPPQAIASTVTLLQRYTAMTLLGLATSDMEEPAGEPAHANGDQVNTARNMKAMAAIATAGRTREEAEKLVGRPIQEWTGADLDKLREWLAPKTSVAAPQTEADAEPAADTSRPVNAEELKRVSAWMKKYEIKMGQMAGLVESATGAKAENAKAMTARQFAILSDKFVRLERGELDLSPKEMRFIEPPPEPPASESGKTVDQLDAEAKQQGIPF